MQIVEKSISLDDLREMAKKNFANLVKAVVDIDKKIMVVDAELHADEEMLLLDQGSQQIGLWEINLHPDKSGTDEWIEFDSMINLRPSHGNVTRSVDNPEIQKKIISIVNKLVE